LGRFLHKIKKFHHCARLRQSLRPRKPAIGLSLFATSCWMKKNSIISPKDKSGRLAGPSVSNNTAQPVCGSRHLVPLLIQAPVVGEAEKLTRSESSLKDVNITTQTGVVVCIPPYY